MKRILFVCTGEKLPAGAVAFLQSIQDQEPICLEGLFFCPLDYDQLATVSHVPGVAPYLQLRDKEINTVNRLKESFTSECQAHYMKCHIHENDERWDKTLFAKESRFSDLVVISGELFCEDAGMKQPNTFLEEALHASECPVMVVPEKYIPVEHLVIAYDSSKDSLFAIKQFCYLFPHLTDFPTEMVYVKDEASDHIPDIELLRQFSRWHFNSMGFSKLHFNATRYFTSWIGEKHSVMLITGAFGRSAFSYVAKRSFAELAIREHAMPVFIAHT